MIKFTQNILGKFIEYFDREFNTLFNASEEDVMRDPDRIPEITNELHDTWTEHPDLRLGQLLLNVVLLDEDLYYIEDDELLERIKTYYNK